MLDRGEHSSVIVTLSVYILGNTSVYTKSYYVYAAWVLL